MRGVTRVVEIKFAHVVEGGRVFPGEGGGEGGICGNPDGKGTREIVKAGRRVSQGGPR